jgi:hypothetical protein
VAEANVGVAEDGAWRRATVRPVAAKPRPSMVKSGQVMATLDRDARNKKIKNG